MLLKSLELQGFKTFPEKTVLSFNKGITAVVGPNGSGKSNISDAIRWVLGEQSTKTLRCSKMEDVIFSGTPNRKPKGFAQITLNIENGDRKLPFETDEVAIKRVFYRSGESEYLVNNEQVRLKDINELFMDTGLGRDGYSIISQGKIDSIVAARSEDRREIFEEAAGISKYRYKKNEAERKLAKAEENLLRLNDILKELEERIGPLGEQSLKAKEYLKLSSEQKSLQIGMWLCVLDQSTDLLKSQDEKLNISMAQYEEIELCIKKIIDETEETLEKIKTCTMEVDSKRREISECEETSIKKTGEISVFENDVLHNCENIKRIGKDIDRIKLSFSNMTEEIAEKNELINVLKEREKETSKKHREQEKTVDNLNRELENLFADLDRQTEVLSQLNEKISGQKSRILTADTALENFGSRISEIETELKTKEYEIEDLNKDFKKYEDEDNRLNADLDKIVSDIKNYEEQYKVKKIDVENKKRQAEELWLDYEGKTRKAKLLDELESNLEGFAQSVKFVVKEGEKGNLNGICGPVSRLIKVPGQYTVAVETALSAAMQNVVVKSENDAKAAISLLKARNIGRATFLPVSTVSGKEIFEKDLENCNGFIGIASRLCETDKEYAGVKDYLLGRIVVVDNLDNAVLISKKFSYRFKVVTLDGQVVNAGGSLTGGAKGKGSGLIGRSADIETTKKQAQELCEKAKDAKAVFEEAVKEENIINEKQVELAESLEQFRRKKADSQTNYRNCSFKMSSIKGEICKLNSEKKVLEDRLSSLGATKSGANDELNEILCNIKTQEAKINKIKEVCSSVKAEKEKANEQLYNLNLEIFSVKKDIEVLERSLKDAENKNISERKQVLDLENEINRLKLQNSEIETRKKDIKNDIIMLKETVKLSHESIDKINKDRMNFEQQSTKFRNEEREKLNEKEKVSLEIARLRDKRDGLQNEYDEIISKLWDEYELTRREAMTKFEKIEISSSVTKRLNELKLKIRNLGTVNVAAIEEYNEVAGRYEFLKGQVEDVEKSKKELYRLISDLTGKMRSLFSERFKKINGNFGTVFKELFGGGTAELRLVEPSDILNSGIEIFVQPPGKIVTNLESLSGGEKAFVSIALYFAIMKVNPAPFCVLDEIEAALDEINVDKFASYLKRMNDKTQFIVISHRRGTMEEADTLYGVTMQNEGISRLLELDVMKT